MNNNDLSKANNLCDNLAAKLKRQNKLIKMADRSSLGWDTVAQCEVDPIASDSEMEKRLDKLRIGHLPNRKVKSLTNLLFAFPVRDQ